MAQSLEAQNPAWDFRCTQNLEALRHRAKGLRVLVSLPFYGGSLPIGHYCTTALKEMGCVVEAFEAPKFLEAHSALKNLRISHERMDQLENTFISLVSQALYARVESFEPDMVLALAQAPLSRQILRRLQADKVTTAMWFVEDYEIFTYWRAFAPLYDYFFVIQKEPFLGLLQETGAKAAYLPLAALPSFHQTACLTPEQQTRFGSDISFLGAGYPNRRSAFRALAGQDFKIWGSDWEQENFLTPYIQEGGRRVSPEESVQIYSAAKININLHSSVRAASLVGGGDFVNPRTFELACLGAFQLVDRRSLMPDLFDLEGKAELATFTSMDELLHNIQSFLTQPEERQGFAQRARARVLKEHCYQHRMARMLDFIDQHKPNWRKQRQASTLPDNLPEGLRQELTALFTRLELPTSASFDDVILSIRQQSGVLSTTEGGLLFLDEWRKQYGPKQ